MRGMWWSYEMKWPALHFWLSNVSSFMTSLQLFAPPLDAPRTALYVSSLCRNKWLNTFNAIELKLKISWLFSYLMLHCVHQLLDNCVYLLSGAGAYRRSIIHFFYWKHSPLWLQAGWMTVSGLQTNEVNEVSRAERDCSQVMIICGSDRAAGGVFMARCPSNCVAPVIPVAQNMAPLKN